MESEGNYALHCSISALILMLFTYICYKLFPSLYSIPYLYTILKWVTVFICGVGLIYGVIGILFKGRIRAIVSIVINVIIIVYLIF